MQPIKTHQELFRLLDIDEAKDVEEGKIKNNTLKRDVARYMLQNIEEYETGKRTSADAANNIASFVQYMFDDDLERISSLASEIEFPGEDIQKSEAELWKEIKTGVVKYLGK